MTMVPRRLGNESRTVRKTGVRSWAFPLYCDPSTAMRTFGSICLNLSITLAAPKSGEQLDQIAPMLAQANRPTTASGLLAMKAATRSPLPTPNLLSHAARDAVSRSNWLHVTDRDSPDSFLKTNASLSLVEFLKTCSA